MLLIPHAVILHVLQVSAKRSDATGVGSFLRAELPCAPTYSERLLHPSRLTHSRKDPPNDRETYLAALAEDVLSLSLPSSLPVHITAHGTLTAASGCNSRSSVVGQTPVHLPDAPVMYINALGAAMAAADLPLRGGLLGAVTVTKQWSGKVCGPRLPSNVNRIFS